MLEPISGTVELKCEVNSCRGWVPCTEEGPWRLLEWREEAGGREKEGFEWLKWL